MSQQAPGFWEDDIAHRRMLADRANGSLQKDGTERMDGALKLPRFTETTPGDTRPPSPEAGDMIWITDLEELQIYDGTVWKVATLT